MAIILTNDLLGKDRREYKAIKAEMMAISQEQKREKQNVNEEETNRIKLSFPRNLPWNWLQKEGINMALCPPYGGEWFLSA